MIIAKIETFPLRIHMREGHPELAGRFDMPSSMALTCAPAACTNCAPAVECHAEPRIAGHPAQ
jgi:hypothetical protein